MGQFMTIYIDDHGMIADVQSGEWEPAAPKGAQTIQHPDDVYSHNSCTKLLELIGIEKPHGWIFGKCDPARVVLVVCYAIHKAKVDRKGTPKAIALAAFREGYGVPDVRRKVLPGLFKTPAKPLDVRKTEATAAYRADQEQGRELIRAFTERLRARSLAAATP